MNIFSNLFFLFLSRFNVFLLSLSIFSPSLPFKLCCCFHHSDISSTGEWQKKGSWWNNRGLSRDRNGKFHRRFFLRFFSVFYIFLLLFCVCLRRWRPFRLENIKNIFFFIFFSVVVKKERKKNFVPEERKKKMLESWPDFTLIGVFRMLDPSFVQRVVMRTSFQKNSKTGWFLLLFISLCFFMISLFFYLSSKVSNQEKTEK